MIAAAGGGAMDDLDAYLATLTQEERDEIEALSDVEIEIIEHDA